MKEWAKREVELACKRENPDWDGKSFDYGCSCYQSALKAFNSLMDDGHSGFSFSMTKHILIRMMEHKPLAPITDEDFAGVTATEYNGLSEKQCPRMYSLFRTEDKDGKVSYHDTDRAYCIEINDPNDTFSCKLVNAVDELFPITMPYCPDNGYYKIYVSEFQLDHSKKDYDHRRIEYIVTPRGEKVAVNNWCFREVNGAMTKCTEEEYEADKAQSQRIANPNNDK